MKEEFFTGEIKDVLHHQNGGKAVEEGFKICLYCLKIDHVHLCSLCKY